MAVGFAQTSTSKEDVIRSLQRSYLVDSEYLEQQREEWNEFYSNRMCKEFSKETLFTPSKYSYSGLEAGTGIIMNPNLQAYHSRDGHRSEAKIASGFWGLQVLRHTYGAKTKYYQEWDFTITVWAGGRYVFHPEQAYRIITRYHSHAVYEEWRKVVKSDLDNFRAVIDAYNPPANMFSVTCCPSSERVCKCLGIPVRNGFAFLTHRKGETCQHKTGTFTPVAN